MQIELLREPLNRIIYCDNENRFLNDKCETVKKGKPFNQNKHASKLNSLPQFPSNSPKMRFRGEHDELSTAKSAVESFCFYFLLCIYRDINIYGQSVTPADSISVADSR